MYTDIINNAFVDFNIQIVELLFYIKKLITTKMWSDNAIIKFENLNEFELVL